LAKKTKPIHITKIVAENIKAARATTLVLNPEGLTEVCGKNGQGKSSAIGALLLALEGAKVLKQFPLSEDAKKGYAEAHLTTGHVVRRTFPGPGKRSTLKVMGPDGKKIPGTASEFLSEVTGDLSFDPMDFVELNKADRRTRLIGVSGLSIDLDLHSDRKKVLHEERKKAHQDALRLEGHVKELGETPDGTPAKEVSVADLSKAHALSVKKHQRVRHLREAVERARENKARAIDAVNYAQAELSKADQSLVDAINAADKIPSDEELGSPEAIQAKIASAEAVNSEVRARWDRDEAKSDAEGARLEWERLEAAMQALEEERAAALRAAKFPIKGLGFGDHDVEFEGRPFETLATSEQIRVSVAIAMALNPKICLLIIHNGSLLDSTSWGVIEESAREHKFQIIGEFVDESGERGIVIEDGQVVE